MSTKEEKKEAKLVKKNEKAEARAAKAQAAAEKRHAKEYQKFVKDTDKKNKKMQAKAAKDGQPFVPIAIPEIDDFQSKREIKAEKACQKAYDKYVKKIEKKNAVAEKKCAKKGKPFVPMAIPTYDEFVNSSAAEKKGGKIVLAVILTLLIILLVYFMVMFIKFDYNPFSPDEETTTAAGSPNVYESYVNPHEITTTPDYSIADAKLYLKQVLSDNWQDLGYSSDPSGSAISYNNRIETINGADCYMFTCGGKTYGVAVKLSACYYSNNGDYKPLTFNETDIIFPED